MIKKLLNLFKKKYKPSRWGNYANLVVVKLDTGDTIKSGDLWTTNAEFNSDGEIQGLSPATIGNKVGEKFYEKFITYRPVNVKK